MPHESLVFSLYFRSATTTVPLFLKSIHRLINDDLATTQVSASRECLDTDIAAISQVHVEGVIRRDAVSSTPAKLSNLLPWDPPGTEPKADHEVRILYLNTYHSRAKGQKAKCPCSNHPRCTNPRFGIRIDRHHETYESGTATKNGQHDARQP